MEFGNTYLDEGPEYLFESCDMKLSLDDGTRMPVHSQVLARCSPVFHGMVAGGTVKTPTAEKMVTVPFGDCSRQEATKFLSAIYSLNPRKHIDEASAFSIARLGDRYGVKVNTSEPHQLFY